MQQWARKFLQRGIRIEDKRLIFGRTDHWIARILFGLALIPIGLSHLFYVKETAELVPAWLPYRIGWAYLTGGGQIACGLGVLFSVLSRMAAIAEAGMLSLLDLLVWLPAIVAAPRDRLSCTAFFITWAIASSGWLVAISFVPRGQSADITRESAGAHPGDVSLPY